MNNFVEFCTGVRGKRACSCGIFLWGELRGGSARGTIPRRAIDDRPYGGLGVGLQCFRPGVCCGATPSALAVSAGGRRSHRYRGQLPREGAMYGGYPCSRENFSADGFLSHRATPAVRPPGSLAAAVSAACWQRSTQSPRAAPEGVAFGRSATGRRNHPRGTPITAPQGAISLRRRRNITVPQAQYHCPAGTISLRRKRNLTAPSGAIPPRSRFR